MSTYARIFGLTLGALVAAACSAPDATSAPDVSLDDSDTLDIGDTYNGWTQYGWAEVGICTGVYRLFHDMWRSYGDATRGGGACLVQSMGTSCPDDAQCTAQVQAAYGPYGITGTYGYCYQGSCYARPGSQADWCVMSPNRSSSRLVRYVGNSPDFYVVNCMSKTAGPTTACGGTNSSLYMRSMNLQPQWEVTGCE